MKTKFCRIISILLVVTMLAPGLVSCDSESANNLKFPSEENMREYLTGTFASNDINYIIDGNKIIKIDLTKIYPQPEEELENQIERLTKYCDNLNQLQFTDYIDLCQYTPEEHTIISYDYKKGTLVCDNITYTIDINGNLVDGTSIYTWQSNSVTYPTADMENGFSDYQSLLLETNKKGKYTFSDYKRGMNAWMSKAGLNTPEYSQDKGKDEEQTVYSGTCCNGMISFVVSSRGGYMDSISVVTPVYNTSFESQETVEAYIANTILAMLQHLPDDEKTTIYNALSDNSILSDDGTLKGSYSDGTWKYSFECGTALFTADAELIN